MVRGAEYVKHGSNATQQVSAKKRQIGVAKGVTAEERENGGGEEDREEARKNASMASHKEGRTEVGKREKKM